MAPPLTDTEPPMSSGSTVLAEPMRLLIRCARQLLRHHRGERRDVAATVSPTDDIHVNPTDMHTAAAGLAAATNTLSAAYTEVAKAMGDIGGMAGSDPAARDWGNDFDTGLA